MQDQKRPDGDNADPFKSDIVPDQDNPNLTEDDLDKVSGGKLGSCQGGKPGSCQGGIAKT